METETPISYRRFNSRPTNRRLWPRNEVRENWFGNWINQNNITTDPWDKIESPQFIDFSNVPETSDKFFETKEEEKPLQHSAEAQTLPITSGYNTLFELLNNFSLSKEKKKHSEENTAKGKEYQKKEEQKLSKLARCIETKHEVMDEKKKNTSGKWYITTKPFNFDFQGKDRLEGKEEYIKKTFNEDKGSKVFRAQPLSKSIKTSVPSKSGCTNTKNISDKYLNKNTEIWKKTPFIARPVKRMLKRPKTPPLLTAARAEERKRFAERLREKEKKIEMLKSLTAIAEKKLEREEIMRLRKEIVHKAQPIRKYKSNLPHIEKRPLTEPLSPFNHKRRRFT